jgi:beta-1,4-mannosyltransferase
MTNQRKEPIISVVGWPAFPIRHSNPYNQLLYTAMRDLGVEVRDFGSTDWRTLDCDVIHVHWPENVLRHPGTLPAIRRTLVLFWIFARLRRRGIRIVWTAHNVEQHERRHPTLARLYWNIFPRFVDGVISLSESNVELIAGLLRSRNVPITVIPHGHYRDAYPDTISPAEARASLDLEDDALVIGWVGAIRNYKNVDGLMTAFCEVAQRGWRLLLAGEAVEQPLHEQLLKRARQDARIRYHPSWVPAQLMQRYLKASDVIVLPYHAIWNSGAALLALSFNVPVVLPRSSTMLELRAQVGDEWVYLYDGKFSGDILSDCVRWLRHRGSAPTPNLDGLSWETIAAKTVTFYRHVLEA